ncbi:MAG TPA: hypothetical protein DCZ75_16195 [Geobacter sp.]|nr:hypothetical protein [Geobacter sp.]
MSSILKALEKVEEAKNPRRTSGAGGLGRGRERRPAWVVPAWALGGAAVAALATFSWMGGFSKPAAPVARQAEKATAPATVVVPPLNVVPEAPASKPVQKTGPRKETTPPRAGVAGAKPSPVRSAVTQAAPAAATPAPAAVAQAASEKGSPAVRVTGIAWQKDSESSVAMVNGRAVRQGGLVDGYKVEQIFESSVRFSGSNGNITVPLGAGEE